MKILALELQTDNLLLVYDFYGDALGLPILDSSPSQITFQVGATQLTFAQGKAQRYHLAFNIPENQYAQAKRWLLQRSSLIKSNQGQDEFPFPNWNAHSLYFYDPVGNVLELIARHNLSNASTQAFSENSLLSVSEIGLAAEDVLATVNALQKTFDLPIYDGKGSDMFSAVGDAEGLFIIVKQGRNWYPDTGIPAELTPLNIVIDHPAMVDFTYPGLPYHIRSGQLEGQKL